MVEGPEVAAEGPEVAAEGCSPVPGRLRTVNVGSIRQIELAGRPQPTAIWKFPVSGRVAVRGESVDGDVQADRAVHGGPDRALYAYAGEDYAWWEAELGRTLEPAMFGDNLTTDGVEVTGALVGEQWRIGSTVLRVTAPRVPCWKLGVRMDDPHFPRRFASAGRPGAYLAIVVQGELGAGDPVEVIHRPAHAVTVGLIADAYHRDHSLAALLLTVPGLPAFWQKWARHQTQAQGRARSSGPL
jgi:MOSC domain-containing protein YiiM